MTAPMPCFTLEQEAHFLYLADRYPCVAILPDLTMYGVDSMADGAALLWAEYSCRNDHDGTI